MTDPLPPVGALLVSTPPDFAEAAVARMAEDHFGRSGRLKRLTSERDLNFQLIAADGESHVLKIANLAEPIDSIRFQTEALLHLERAAPDLPVPRVVRTRAGASDVTLPEGNSLRLLSWVEGEPLHRARSSAAQSRAMAGIGAALARALRGFDHPAADHDLLWDIKQAARLRALLPAITDGDLRHLVEARLDVFDARIAPALPALRWQVVHNDLNPHNVLVDPADHARVTGILDFGDMVRTPLVCDVAVTASYQIDAADPLASLVAFACAWHAVDPLMESELDLLYDLVATRMITTIAIAGWRAARYPDNAAYILRNVPRALAGLQAFDRLSPAQVRSHLATACPTMKDL
ncbi:MAG: phosphotransferase [Rhodobacteraceae bacterium]|nr:phosphotransferase [Paracoccaceae bacterium]